MPQNAYQTQAQTQQMLQTLSPYQILLVKLLELPTMELEERVRAEVLDNPALEEGREPSEQDGAEDFDSAFNGGNESDNEDFSLGDYRTEDDIPDYKLQEQNRSRGETMEEIPFSDSVSFYELLLEQLGMQHLTEEEKVMAEYLIGSLDDDGLLRKEMTTLVDELAIYRGIYTDEQTLERVLGIIQDFEPVGVGARNLQECLTLQIKRKPDTPLKSLQLEVVEKCFDDFTHKNKERIMQRLDIDEETYWDVLGELTRLNPRPGTSLGEAVGKNLQQIIPDFLVETEDDGTVTLTLNNGNVPELRLSREFSEMLEEYALNRENQSRDSKDAFLFLKQKVDAAQGFINAVKQRHQTLTAVMQSIIDLQRPFFEEGDENLLKPMIMKDVAERAKLDVSTVSRVSNSKYVQTPWSIYPLKYFFSDGIVKDDGTEQSVYELFRVLRELVDEEDKQNPLTDQALQEALQERGYNVARRTVAKYREQLGIPVARLRRE